MRAPDALVCPDADPLARPLQTELSNVASSVTAQAPLRNASVLAPPRQPLGRVGDLSRRTDAKLMEQAGALLSDPQGTASEPLSDLCVRLSGRYSAEQLLLAWT